MTRSILAFFDRLGRLFVAPRVAIDAARDGSWNALRDALWLMAVGALAAYTPDVGRIFTMTWDLGPREGLHELVWAFQRRLGPDLLALLLTVVGFAVLLRPTRRLSFERCLALAAACWTPLFVVRLAGHGVRFALHARPAWWIHDPEWLIGLALLVGLAGCSLLLVFRSPGEDA